MLARGRPVHEKDLKKKQVIMDSVLAVWPENQQVIHFMEIHQALLEKGLVANEIDRYKTDRLLKWLIKDGYIEKVDRGKYKITVKPDEFKLFDYLQKIRSHYRGDNLNFNSRTGGTLWASNETYHLGMPEEICEHPDANFCLQILSIRLDRIFQALKSVSQTLKMRRDTDERIPLPPEIVRQVLTEIVPFHIESKIGPDRDGLYYTDLHEVIGQIIHELPESVETQEGWSSSLEKDRLDEYYQIISKFLKETEEHLDKKREEDRIEWEKNPVREVPLRPERYHYAMIITEPEYLIDEIAHEKRQLYEEIEELVKEGIDDIIIAASLPLYDPDITRDVLSKYGTRLFGRKRLKSIKNLYEKIWACHVISSWLNFPLMPNRYENEVHPEIFEGISNVIELGHTEEELIRYMAHSRGSVNFSSPTKKKMNLLYKLFPNLPKDKINMLYLEGVKEARKYSDYVWKELKQTFDNHLREKQ